MNPTIENQNTEDRGIEMITRIPSADSEETLTQTDKVQKSLDAMDKVIAGLKNKNTEFLSNPPTLAGDEDNVNIIRKKFLSKEFPEFEKTLAKRKLVTNDVIGAILDVKVKDLREEISDSENGIDMDISEIQTKLDKLGEDLASFTKYLDSSSVAIEDESKRSKGNKGLMSSLKASFQGSEHGSNVIRRSFLQSLATTAVSAITQLIVMPVKTVIYNKNTNQLLATDADALINAYLPEQKKITNSTTDANKNMRELVDNVTNYINTTNASNSSDLLTNIVDLGNNMTNSPTNSPTNDPVSAISTIAELCAYTVDYVENLKPTPTNREELELKMTDALKDKIVEIGDKRSLPHSFIETLKNCVNLSEEITNVSKPDSSYYNTEGMDALQIISTDAIIGFFKGAVIPYFDSKFENKKDNETSESATNFEKFKIEVIASVKNQAMGTAMVMTMITGIKAAIKLTNNEEFTKDFGSGFGKDMAFNTVIVMANAAIDGYRKSYKSELSEKDNQALKANLRLILARFVPQLLKTGLSRGKEWPATLAMVAIDTATVLASGWFKEALGAKFQASAKDPEGFLNSNIGRSNVYEKEVLKIASSRTENTAEGVQEPLKEFITAIKKVNNPKEKNSKRRSKRQKAPRDPEGSTEYVENSLGNLGQGLNASPEVNNNLNTEGQSSLIANSNDLVAFTNPTNRATDTQGSLITRLMDVTVLNANPTNSATDTQDLLMTLENSGQGLNASPEVNNNNNNLNTDGQSSLIADPKDLNAFANPTIISTQDPVISTPTPKPLIAKAVKRTNTI
jgi:hypothetical protein